MSGLPPPPPSVSASLRPSGDHSGAPLTPARADTWRRSPLRTSCTYTPECLVSNDTYASHCPSGDRGRHEGEARLENQVLVRSAGIGDDELVVLRRRATVGRHV